LAGTNRFSAGRDGDLSWTAELSPVGRGFGHETPVFPMRVDTEKAFDIAYAINVYLLSKYGPGDKTWHPLFTAGRELFAYLIG
jgi:hypothetical protein